MNAAATITLVFLGCCSNFFFLELLVKEDAGSGNMITFSQFVVTAVEGFITTMKFGTCKPKIPIKEYFKMVVVFFVVSVLNNYALNFHISLPLHMIFRSASLLANMILGVYILRRSYSHQKYLSVVMITVGVFTCTLASAKQLPNKANKHGSLDEETASIFSDFFWWLIGITLLTIGLFLGAGMGVLQEMLYTKYGKHPRELLFFTHALPLPGFLFLAGDLIKHFQVMNSSPGFDLLQGIPILCFIPRMWIYLLGNVLTQCICINMVCNLSAMCSSLTVTLVVTLRKFFSLLLSIWYFQNPFTLTHWFGTFLVFAGTALFSDIPALIRQSRKIKSQ